MVIGQYEYYHIILSINFSRCRFPPHAFIYHATRRILTNLSQTSTRLRQAPMISGTNDTATWVRVTDDLLEPLLWQM